MIIWEMAFSDSDGYPLSHSYRKPEWPGLSKTREASCGLPRSIGSINTTATNRGCTKMSLTNL